MAVVKNPPASAGDAGDVGSIPGLGRSPGEGNGNPLQYSCVDYPTDRGAWWVIALESQKVRHDLVTKHKHDNIHMLHITHHAHKHT